MTTEFLNGQACARTWTEDQTQTPTELAADFREIFDALTTEPAITRESDFWSGYLVAVGLALADRVDDGAFSPGELNRLAFMKTLVERGDVSDHPPAA